jgi:teichuronic acid biosynthesis glycosyltransferase TuaG
MQHGMVSVIIPSFNAQNVILRAIESVLSQTYQNLEIIIIDDQSDDATFNTVYGEYSADERFLIIQNNENIGAGATRNRGIEIAQGEYIAFLDADDEWYPEKLECQVEALEKSQQALICSGYDITKANTPHLITKLPSKRISYQDLLRSNKIGCLTAMYSVKKIGKQYMLPLRKRQDYALWLQITQKYGPALCIQKPLARYYIQENSISSNKIKLIIWNYKMFRLVTNYNMVSCALLTLRNAIIKIIYR